VFPIRYIPTRYRNTVAVFGTPNTDTGKNLPVFAGIENVKMATFDQTFLNAQIGSNLKLWMLQHFWVNNSLKKST
jgi:hypothetical protein